jgi:hypothetical protein
METHNQPAREKICEQIDHLATDKELGIEEIDRKQRLPAEPAKPVADIPLTGVSVCPLDGIIVVEEPETPGELVKMEKKRLQIDFSDKAYKDLEALQERLDATSKSEVIRDALGLLRWLADHVLIKNHRILLEKPEEGGATREIVFHFLERSRSQDSQEDKKASRTRSAAMAHTN